MSDQSHARRIFEVADTNPESLGAATPPSYRFRYIDLSAASSGFILWDLVGETTFMEAPSRARRVVRSGDTLFGTVRPNLQSHGRIDSGHTGELVASTGFSVIRARPGVSDPSYLFHSIMSGAVLAQANRNAIGSSYPALNDGDVRNFQIFSPPYEEQKVAGRVLDTLDTAIRETESIITKLKAVKQGLLHDLLTRGIDANGELRPPQPEAPNLYKQSPLGWIPKEWAASPIADWTLASVIGPFGSDLVAADYRTSGVPVIFVRDIKPDRLEWKSNVFVSKGKAAALAAHEARPGDVVATKMGFPPCIAAVYPDQMPVGIITADIVCLRPIPSRIHPGWMSAYMNSPAVARQVDQITAGVTRPKVTLRDVRNLVIAAPTIDEQGLLIERISSIESKIQFELAALSKFRAEKAGLMDDLLTGRVRVTPLLSAEQQAQTRSA